MAEKIKLRLVTPVCMLLDEEVDEVAAPGVWGEFGVLPNHISFLSLLESGELTYKQGAAVKRLAVAGGYAEVLDNVMTVLAPAAEFAEEIDLERARRAMEMAEAKMEGLNRESEEFAAAEAALRRAQVRIQIAAKSAHN